MKTITIISTQWGLQGLTNLIRTVWDSTVANMFARILFANIFLSEICLTIFNFLMKIGLTFWKLYRSK